MAEERIAKPHALLVCMPFQGHFTPAVDLAIKLAAKGLVITFANIELLHRQISLAHGGGRDDIFADARAAGLDIRYELVSDGLPLSSNRSGVDIDQVASFIGNELVELVEELIARLLRASPPITCLIADTFFIWPSTLAKKFGIPYVSFWTEPAIVFTIYYHLELLIKNGHLASSHQNRKDTITYIPGVPAIEPADLMSYLQDTDISSMVHQAIFKAFEKAKGADFVLCNTVQELEPEAIAALQQEKPFYAVGPLFSEGFAGSTVKTSLFLEHECSQWLDLRSPGSVLYVSFGSLAYASKRDLEEISYGILGSKVSFVMVCRGREDASSADEADSETQLPDGFMEESRGRGIVVPWCRQREVLMHPSVGGFLTHCGWNSILESIWCGVPMLCFPLLTDQFTNRKLIVKAWRIGLDIGGLNEVTREEVSNKIDSLMRGEDGHRLKWEIKELKKVVESAIAKNGSSKKNLDRFIEDLSKHENA